jgi:general stress protein 26
MAEEKSEYWIEEQALASIDPSVVDKWGDPNKHPETQLSPAQQQALLHGGREVFISHLTKEGFPMVTVHVYVVLDGVIWSTSVKGRVKAAAYRRDPRCALCISTSGVQGLDFGGGMTIKARAEVIEDRAIVERICREHGKRYYTSPKAQELFTASLFTPNRVALRFHIDNIVSWKNIGMRQS